MIDLDYYNHLCYHHFIYLIILPIYLFELLTLHILNNIRFIHLLLCILPIIYIKLNILLFYSDGSYTLILIETIVLNYFE